jgi:hypothetical protein
MTLYKLVFSYAYNMGVSTHLAGMRMCVYCEREENLRTPCRCLVGAGSFGMADFSVRMCCCVKCHCIWACSTGIMNAVTAYVIQKWNPKND